MRIRHYSTHYRIVGPIEIRGSPDLSIAFEAATQTLNHHDLGCGMEDKVEQTDASLDMSRFVTFEFPSPTNLLEGPIAGYFGLN